MWDWIFGDFRPSKWKCYVDKKEASNQLLRISQEPMDFEMLLIPVHFFLYNFMVDGNTKLMCLPPRSHQGRQLIIKINIKWELLPLGIELIFTVTPIHLHQNKDIYVNYIQSFIHSFIYNLQQPSQPPSCSQSPRARSLTLSAEKRERKESREWREQEEVRANRRKDRWSERGHSVLLNTEMWRIPSDIEDICFRTQNLTMTEAERQSELEAISMRANNVVDESLESTRRMLALCEEVRL